MKTKLHSIKTYLFNHKLISIIAIIVLVSGIIFLSSYGKDSNADTIKIAPKEFTREIQTAGKVVASKDVSLSFETSGRIAAVYKKVNQQVKAGETIAVLSSTDIQASQLKAQADLDAEIAKLNELKAGTSGTDTETLNAKRSLVEDLLNAYVQADDAIHNKVDQFYKDPFTRTPDILFAFNNFQLKQKLDKDRVQIEIVLTTWEKERKNISISSVSSNDVEKTKSHLREIQTYLNDVSKAVNAFESSEGLAQNQIDKYKSDVAQARSNINSAITSIITTQEKSRGIEAQIPFQEAKVKAARANVLNYSAQIGKTVIRAPFSGIIAKQDAKVGEYASSNVPVVTLISSNSFQVETYVPEVHIKEVKIGDTANVTLDAFSAEDIFKVIVISIDPAETVRDGVSTYKVIFGFEKNDARLKSGMTANVTVLTATKQNSILIPQKAVINKNGVDYVQIKVGKEIVEKQITKGSIAASGEVEIVSGLSEGENLIIAPEIKK